MTALTVYLTQTASSTVSTADTLVENTTGGTLSNKNTNLTANTTGWVEIYSQGQGTSQTGAGSEPSPSGHGWCDDNTNYSGFHFASGSWSFSLGFELSVSGGTFTADFHFRAYQRSSGGTYTLIGEATATNQTIVNANYTVVTASGTFSASNTFAGTDHLYVDCIMNITTNSTSANMRMQASSSSTQGNTNAQVVTPGYISSTQVDKDVAIRGRISAQVDKDVAIRGRIQQLITKDIKLRGNIGLLADKDIKLRAVIAGLGLKDIVVRGRVSQQVTKDIAIRGRPANTVTKDIAIRAKITGPPLTSGGFTLFANGTGTASFDHFRVTEYPDPALSLAPITPRAGTTLVSWNALTPASTTLGVDISLDGVNWTDVTSSNNGSLPGIYSQVDPVIDGFDTNTSSNYTSAFRTGGSVVTVTYDTTHSRIALTGGSNAIYAYSSINRADVDFFTDMDQSDAGGLCWRYINANNLYYLVIADSLSSVGTPNTMTLYRVVSNVQTTLGTAALSYSVGTPSDKYTVTFTRGTYHRFRVSMLMGAITVYMDGKVMITATDNSPLGPGLMGLYNNGGTVGSRYYQLWMAPQGDYVTGTPLYDIVTGDFVYTRLRLATTDPSVTPQVEDITTMVTAPSIGVGTSIPSVTYNATYISKNFDDLAKQSNYSWYIDQSKIFHFGSRGAVAAPWILQSAPYGLVTTTDLEVNSDLELDVENDLYRNRQIVLGATDTATFVENKVGDGNTRSFTLGYPLASAPSIVLNGNPIASTQIGVKGTTGYQYYYAINDPVIVQDSSLAILQATDQLTITYVGLFDVTVTVDDTAEQTARAAIEGGTGIVEEVEDVTGQGMNKAAAIAFANQLLDRYAIAGRTLIFDTTRDGLAVGQLLSIFLVEHGIFDGQFFITQVEIYLKKGVSDTQVWIYKVTASELPKQASWAKLLASGIGLQ